MSRKASVESTILLNRARAKFEIGDFTGALEDLKEISAVELEGIKSINMGLCYFKIGLYDEAERQYRAAIKLDSKLITAYYNLAALHTTENNIEKAKLMLRTCLKIDRNFLTALEALKSLRKAEHLDWFEWWFKTDGKRKFLGTVTIITIFALIALFGYLSFHGSERVGLSIPLGILVAMLMLPSLKKVKVGSIEMETLPVGSVATIIEPIFALMPPAQVSKPESRPSA